MLKFVTQNIRKENILIDFLFLAIHDPWSTINIAKRCSMYEDALYLNTTETLSSAVNTFHMCAVFFK